MKGLPVSDLTDKEQRAVRTTLLFLRVRAGGAWEPVARALHVEEDTIAKVAHGRRPVTARLAIRVARLVEVGVDDLLAGGTCHPGCARTAATRRTTSSTRKRLLRTDNWPVLTALTIKRGTGHDRVQNWRPGRSPGPPKVRRVSRGCGNRKKP